MTSEPEMVMGSVCAVISVGRLGELVGSVLGQERAGLDVVSSGVEVRSGFGRDNLRWCGVPNHEHVDIVCHPMFGGNANRLRREVRMAMIGG